MTGLRDVPVGAAVEKCPLEPGLTFDDKAIDPPLLNHTLTDEPPPLLRHTVQATDRRAADAARRSE